MVGVTLGVGVWSMHFIAMLAIKLPVPISYDPLRTLASALIAVLVVGLALSSAAFFIIAIGLLLKSRHSPIVSGRAEMLGAVGLVLEGFTGAGRVRIHSEQWQAFCEQPLAKNEKVKVTAIDGLLLQVMPIKKLEDK